MTTTEDGKTQILFDVQISFIVSLTGLSQLDTDDLQLLLQLYQTSMIQSYSELLNVNKSQITFNISLIRNDSNTNRQLLDDTTTYINHNGLIQDINTNQINRNVARNLLTNTNTTINAVSDSIENAQSEMFDTTNITQTAITIIGIDDLQVDITIIQGDPSNTTYMSTSGTTDIIVEMNITGTVDNNYNMTTPEPSKKSQRKKAKSSLSDGELTAIIIVVVIVGCILFSLITYRTYQEYQSNKDKKQGEGADGLDSERQHMVSSGGRRRSHNIDQRDGMTLLPVVAHTGDVPFGVTRDENLDDNGL